MYPLSILNTLMQCVHALTTLRASVSAPVYQELSALEQGPAIRRVRSQLPGASLAKSHPVDVYVGTRIRQRRSLLGMSQSKVGEAVGLTFQQIQKYERGSNRIGSSRLYEFAKVLDVPVSYFFDEMPSNALSGRPMSGRGRKGFGEAGTPFEQEKDPLIKRETLELVRAYYKIREGRVRTRIFEMVKAVGAASNLEVLGGAKRRNPAQARK